MRKLQIDQVLWFEVVPNISWASFLQDMIYRYRFIDIGVGIDVGTVQISYNPRGTQVNNPNSIETTEHLYDNHRPSSFSSSDVGAEPTPVSWVLITKTANRKPTHLV